LALLAVPKQNGIENKEDEMTDKEKAALKEIREKGQIKVQLGAAAIVVVNCPLTGKRIEKSNLAHGFVVGRKEGVLGYMPYAYIVRLGGVTYNASRNAFKVLEE
jgi:hypothetical protein